MLPLLLLVRRPWAALVIPGGVAAFTLASALDFGHGRLARLYGEGR